MMSAERGIYLNSDQSKGDCMTDKGGGGKSYKNFADIMHARSPGMSGVNQGHMQPIKPR